MTQQFQRLRLTSKTHPGQVSHWYFSRAIAIEYLKITCYILGPKEVDLDLALGVGLFRIILKDLPKWHQYLENF